MEFKEFVVLTTDGVTLDNDGKEFDNCQILDFIEAKNPKEALNKLNNFGNYNNISVYEINRNNGVSMVYLDNKKDRN